MMRAILGFTAGLIVMTVTVIVGFVVGPFVFGTELVLEEESYKATFFWNVCSAIIGLVAAVLGGAACQLISRNKRAAIALAILAFVASIPAVLRGPDPEPPARPADVVGFKAIQGAMMHPYEPLFTRILNVVLGTGGVLLGSFLIRRESRTAD